MVKSFFTEQEGVIKPPEEKAAEKPEESGKEPTVDAPHVENPPPHTRAEEVGDPVILRERKEFFSKEEGRIDLEEAEHDDESKKKLNETGHQKDTEPTKEQLTQAKAKQILRDDEVKGEPVSTQQKKFFGAIAGGEKPRQ